MSKNGTQAATIGDHAVVLGASMSGLLAARVLSDFYRRVTVVERDMLGDDASNRRGVPQGRHAHLLMSRGSQILAELFPGLLDDMVAEGTPVWDDGDLSKVLNSAAGHLIVRSGRFIDNHSTTFYSASRPFLESKVRCRVQGLANVEILGGHDVVELTSTEDRDRVTGVRVLNRDSDIEQVLTADLVVDAMGRGSRTPAFLDALGYGRPVEDEVVVRLVYRSRALRIPTGMVPEKMLVVGFKPGRPKTVALFHNEHDTWLLTLGGMMGCEPPTEFPDMIDFVEDFAPPHMVAALRAAEPVSDASQHRVPSNRWRRYDRLRRLPRGLLVVGDAICSFNPVYGQGMTVAALDALSLRDCLRRGGDDLPRRFFNSSAKAIRVAWKMAAGSDLALPEVDGIPPLPDRVVNRYTNRVLSAAESDCVVAEQFIKVINLVDPPARLMRPSILLRVATAGLRRRRQARRQSVTDDRIEAMAA